MRVIRGGLSRPTKQRNAVRWTLAISALALAFPATAFGAQKGPEHNASRANTGPSRDAGLGRTVLAVGSGYSSPGGSPQVRYLQRRLALAGYSPGKIDGLYGPRTKQAVVAFQTSHDLSVDGIVGPNTWAVLSSPILALGPGAGNQSGGSNTVRSLQRRLAAVGDSPGPIDGRYGVLTEEAVMRFQRAHGLPVTGLAGPPALTLLTTPVSRAGRSKPVSRMPAASLPQSSTGARPRAVHARLRSVRPTAPAVHPARRSVRPTAPAVHPARRSVRPTAPAAHPAPRSARPIAPAVHPIAPATHPAMARALQAPRRSGQRHGSTTPPWMILLALPALILAVPMLVVGVRRARPRDSVETAVATTSRGKPRQPTREQLAVTPANGSGRAVAANNHENQIHTNGHRADATRGHGGNGAQTRLSRRDETDLFASAEAAAAFNLGLLLEAQGRKVEAGAAYGRADERGHGPAASNLGRLLEEQGGLAEAEAAYRRADQRGDAAGAVRLGMLLKKRGSVDEAAAVFARASDRGNNAAASYLGVLLAEQGAAAEAEAAFRRADERGDPCGAFNLGTVLEARGALRDAEQAFRRVTERAEGAIADDARAALLDLRGRLDEAAAARDRRADAA